MKNWELVRTRKDYLERLAQLEMAGEITVKMPTRYPVAICPRMSADPGLRLQFSYDLKSVLHPLDLQALTDEMA
jgi:hypothetical protein